MWGSSEARDLEETREEAEEAWWPWVPPPLR